MRGRLFFILCAVMVPIFFSCSNPVREERKAILPADSVIPEPVMVQMLADMHILEAGLMARRSHGDKLNNWPSQLYQTLFSKYGVTEQRFKKNLQYYQCDLQEYSALYDRVIRELNQRNKWIPGNKKPSSHMETPKPLKK